MRAEDHYHNAEDIEYMFDLLEEGARNEQGNDYYFYLDSNTSFNAVWEKNGFDHHLTVNDDGKYYQTIAEMIFQSK